MLVQPLKDFKRSSSSAALAQLQSCEWAGLQALVGLPWASDSMFILWTAAFTFYYFCYLRLPPDRNKNIQINIFPVLGKSKKDFFPHEASVQTEIKTDFLYQTTWSDLEISRNNDLCYDRSLWVCVRKDKTLPDQTCGGCCGELRE